MANEQATELKVKNTSIKQIFHTMEYGNISENINLAKEWLAKRKNIICAYADKKEEELKGKANEILDVNNGAALVTVYTPLLKNIEKIVNESENHKNWSNIEPLQRGILLERFAKAIERNSTLICQMEISVRGILSTDTKSKALPLLVEYLQYYASWAVKSKAGQNKEPAASFISDTSFLAVFGFALGPALASGRNVLLQTEPRITPVAALIIELAESIGIPEGVIQLIPGVIDPALICKSADCISRFGSITSPQYQHIEKGINQKFLIIANAKAPMIVFNNGDLDSACDSVIDAAWGYQGLLPWSVNTVLVQEDIFQSFVDKLKYRLSKVKMGFATDKMADISYPVILSESAGTPIEALQKAVKDAALQGIEVFQPNSKSNTFQPTLLIGGKLCSNKVMTEENNLPIVTILAFRSSNEAVSLANNSRHGFAASIWTENIGLANEVAGKLNVGIVWINSHGNLTSAVSFTPRKQSGVGYFGGGQGLFEYMNIPRFFLIYEANKQKPIKTEGNMLQSFYAGSFKKSESGLIDGVYDHPVGKDLYNAIEAAKKGQVVWSQMTVLQRSQLLRKVADEFNNRKLIFSEKSFEIEVQKWIFGIYEGLAQLDNLESVTIHKSYELKTITDPVGVVAIEGGFDFVNVIVGTLLLGNSVIILDFSQDYSHFIVEVCKIFSTCSIPAGVFNVILNCNEDVLKTFVAHEELNVYLSSLTSYEVLDKIKVRDLKEIYSKENATWKEIIRSVTKIKNVWTNIGDSVL